jgi:sterol O-acyltransferase
MIMKTHSYMATNGYLRYVSQQSAEILSQLRDATVRVGGWEKAIFDAKRRREDLECEPDTDTTGTSPSPFGTLELRGGALSTSYAEVTLRTRSPQSPDTRHRGRDNIRDRVSRQAKRQRQAKTPLTFLSPYITRTHKSLCLSCGIHGTRIRARQFGTRTCVRWTEYIAFKNFAVYQRITTLVYELEYPPTKKHVLALSKKLPRSSRDQ